MKSKLDFTKDKLEPLILELADLAGYETPSTYLDELLKEVKKFKDASFEGNFFLNIHYLCKEHEQRFWSEGHRKDISKWLLKARIVTDVFSTTWEAATEKYFLGFSDVEAMEKTHEFKNLKDGMNTKGVAVKNHKGEIIARIFTPHINYLLTQSKIQCTVHNSEEVKFYDGWRFMQYYTDAFKNGEQDFEKAFGVSTNTLYATAKQYVMNIHNHYYHATIIGPVTIGEGWIHWRKTYPRIITKKTIAEYGYYAGFIAKVFDLATKHPQLFRDYDNCALREHNKAKENQSDTLKVEEPIEKNRTKVLIEKEFENVKDKCFSEKIDYDNFIDILVSFFESKPYKLPKSQIKLKRGCKTKIAAIFNPIHQQLSEVILKNDSEYFKIIKVLNHFSNEADLSIYKAITR